MYGAQTMNIVKNWGWMFENDVEMYGAQTALLGRGQATRLRMM